MFHMVLSSDNISKFDPDFYLEIIATVMRDEVSFYESFKFQHIITRHMTSTVVPFARQCQIRIRFHKMTCLKA